MNFPIIRGTSWVLKMAEKHSTLPVAPSVERVFRVVTNPANHSRSLTFSANRGLCSFYPTNYRRHVTHASTNRSQSRSFSIDTLLFADNNNKKSSLKKPFT